MSFSAAWEPRSATSDAFSAIIKIVLPWGRGNFAATDFHGCSVLGQHQPKLDAPLHASRGIGRSGSQPDYTKPFCCWRTPARGWGMEEMPLALSGSQSSATGSPRPSTWPRWNPPVSHWSGITYLLSYTCSGNIGIKVLTCFLWRTEMCWLVGVWESHGREKEGVEEEQEKEAS